jgi:hypothetical protein
MAGKKMVSVGVCPWCQSPVNLGAAACKSCGASESTHWEQAGPWRLYITLMCLFLIPLFGVVILLVSPVVGAIFILLGIGGYILARRRMKGSRSWVASGGRALI